MRDAGSRWVYWKYYGWLVTYVSIHSLNLTFLDHLILIISESSNLRENIPICIFFTNIRICSLRFRTTSLQFNMGLNT